MKKCFTFKALAFSILALSASIGGFKAQNNNGNDFSCGSLIPAPHLVDYQDYLANREAEIEMIKKGFAGATMRAEDSVFVIPIVFHILHEYGSENISKAQIEDQMRILNEDYAKINADTIDVNPEFVNLIGTPKIEFRLAQIDPNGNPTEGIDRIYTQEANFGDDGAKMHNWPRAKYLNVWVVRNMEGGTAGYAYYPSATVSGAGAFIDGIIIRHNYIGSIGTGNANNSRALTHEVGHYLSLAHVWGNTNDPGVACGDDGFDDTPVTKGWNFCPSASNSDECNTGVFENYQNFMEYSYCSHMFTMDQVTAMRTVLYLPTALRNNLWSEDNLLATGVSENSPAQAHVPIAEFNPSKTHICEGGLVSFSNESYNADIDTYEWTFEGGTPSTSSSQNPSVTFSGEGWHKVTLKVTNANGSDTYVQSRSVYVSPEYSIRKGVYVDNIEGIDNSNFQVFYPNTNYAEENTLNVNVLFGGGTVNVADWQVTSQGSYSGSKSLMLDAYGSNNNMSDYFMTPNYDLRLLSSGVFTFKWASAVATTDAAEMNETLKIYSSTNCGDTWILRGTISGVDVNTAGYSGENFVPTSSQWQTYEYNIPGSLKNSNVRFKVEFTSGDRSNNIYIDDIGVNGTMSVENSNELAEMAIYPNPTENGQDLKLSFSSASNDVLSIQVVDQLGKVISTIDGVSINAGENVISFSDYNFAQNLSKGIYLVKVTSESNASFVNKVIIK